MTGKGYGEKWGTHMVDEAQTSRASVEKTSYPVTPAETSDSGRNQQTNAKDEVDVPAVLPLDDLILAQVTNIRHAGLVAGLEDHPANVRVPEALVGVVRVEVGVGVPMVSTVTAGPPLDGALDCARSCHCQEVLEGLGRVIRPMRP